MEKVLAFIFNFCIVLLLTCVGLHILNNIFDWHLKFYFRAFQLSIGAVAIVAYLLSIFIEKRKKQSKD
ncbi:hypothetical protein BUY46_11905 [Staphylococcus devriesei]|nr:hypothetical protein BUY46_11905 [Staphylococcus devriesei]